MVEVQSKLSLGTCVNPGSDPQQATVEGKNPPLTGRNLEQDALQN